jgi:hypothetical protein
MELGSQVHKIAPKRGSMMNRAFHIRLSGILLLLALGASACNLGQTSGTVKGVVYADLNGDGRVDPGEGPLAGVVVSIDGCGTTQTGTTAADGAFDFTGLAPGACSVSASKPDWVFTGSQPGGGYPIPVTSDKGVVTSLSVSLAPAAALVPTATPTPEFTPTLTLTPTETFTPTSSTPMVQVLDKTANCRYGPSLDYLPVGSMPPGEWVPIDATIGNESWWRIQLPSNPTIYCWIGASLSETAGDLNQVQVVEAPGGEVIGITLSVPSLLHGSCSGSNTNDFTGTLTTNGPGEVLYHWVVDNSKGLNMNSSSSKRLIFHTAGTLEVDSWSFTGGCGNYVVKLIATDPNQKVATASYQVEP